MKKKTANMIRMMAFEGKSLRQIAAKTDLNVEEIEDYLLAQGIPPTYTVKQQREERKMNESMNEMRVLGKPLNQTTLKGKEKLTAEQRQELMHKLECGVNVSRAAKEYGLSEGYVYKIKKKLTASVAGKSLTDEPPLDVPIKILETISQLIGGKDGITAIYANEKHKSVEFVTNGVNFSLTLSRIEKEV